MGDSAEGAACWVVGAPDLRPFDVPARLDSSSPWMGIDAADADPSGPGYLSPGPGQRHFKKASVAARYVHKKRSKYSRILHQHSIRYPVTCTLLGFEVSGGFTKKVRSLVSDLLEAEEASKATPSPSEWSWSAMDLGAFFQQAPSFNTLEQTCDVVLFQSDEGEDAQA